MFNSFKIDYDFKNLNKNTTVIFLHGWGGNKNSFIFLHKYLSNDYNLLSISFPPYFLSNTESVSSLNLYDYITLLENICVLHNIKNCIIVCHSFGIRLTLFSQIKNFLNVKKIVICAGAGITLNSNFIKKLIINQKTILYKKRKIKNINREYEDLSNIDKITFKNIVDKNLINFTNLLKCPTMLFWGKKDKATPYKIFKYLKKNLNVEKAIILNSHHFAYLQHRSLFINESLKFIKEQL